VNIFLYLEWPNLPRDNFHLKNIFLWIIATQATYKKLLKKSTDLDQPFFVGNISPKRETLKTKK